MRKLLSKKWSVHYFRMFSDGTWYSYKENFMTKFGARCRAFVLGLDATAKEIVIREDGIWER